MKISAKIDYACRALLELSLHWPDESPLQIHEIAHRQKIPIKFLVHILIHLKQLDYLKSIRGKKGGYVLTRNPREIKLSEVMKSFGGLGLTQKEEKRPSSEHIMDNIWQQIDKKIFAAVEEINFETICLRVQNRAPMYEI